MQLMKRSPQAAFAPHAGTGGGMNGQSTHATQDRGNDALRGGGRGGIAGPGAQGTWLSNQQYKEYLELLKQRAQAQQVVSVPLNPATYPGVTIGAGGGLAPYSVNQPGYGFLAPSGGGAKAAGYGGLPSPRPTGLPKRSV